jgi:hypothetical protein
LRTRIHYPQACRQDLGVLARIRVPLDLPATFLAAVVLATVMLAAVVLAALLAAGARDPDEDAGQEAHLLVPRIAQLPSGARRADGGIARVHGELRRGGDGFLGLGSRRGQGRPRVTTAATVLRTVSVPRST